MRTPRRLILSIPTLVLLIAGAAVAEPVRLSTVAIGGAGLTLQPLVPYESAILAVAGEGRRVFRRTFEPQEPIAFAPVDSAGYPLADGSYRWELRLVVEAMTANASGAPPTAGVLRQSGRFVVRGGTIQAPPAPDQTPELAPEPAGPNDVTITDTDPSLFFVDTTVGDDDFSIDVDGDVMSVVRQASEEILTIQSGVVGLFQAAPDPNVSLHISTGTAIPAIRLEGTSGSWDLIQSSNDLQLRDSGELFAPTVLEVEKTGTEYELIFDGDGIFEGDFTAGSSRQLKRDLEPAPSDQLLAALTELPLYAWTYKKDPDGVRHLGPMAEDFHAAFGLGKDDKHISPADTAGLALAAIQALAERLEEKERRIAELERRLQALESQR